MRSRNFLFLAVLIAMLGLLVACQGEEAEPEVDVEPEIVEVTRIVEVEGEPEMVEVTRIVEGEVVTEQVEVTRIVEVEGEAPETGLATLLNEDVSGDVEFWHFWGSPARRTAIRRIVAMCDEAMPNITITEVFKPFGEIWTANIAAVAAGSGMPDVIVADRPQIPRDASDEVYQSLQPFIEQDNFDLANFWDFTVQEATYQDEVYGIPFETDVRVLFWNKQAFAEAGLDPEDPPETWEELEEYAAALDIQNEDGSWERIGFFPLWNAGVNFWAWTNGWEQVVDGRPNYNDPAYIEAVAWVQEWVEKYGGWQNLQNFRANYGAAPNDIFMSGAVPMVVDVAGYLTQLTFYRPRVTTVVDGEEQTVNMEWGVANIPYNTEPANWSGGFALSIPAGAEDPEAAWEVIKCISSAEGQSSWARDTFSIPTNRNVATSTEMMVVPEWPTIMGAMETSQGTTYVPEYPNFFQEVGPVEERVWTGELTPEEAAQTIQENIDAVIEENTGG